MDVASQRVGEARERAVRAPASRERRALLLLAAGFALAAGALVVLGPGARSADPLVLAAFSAARGR
jgi:hypothetical protein